MIITLKELKEGVCTLHILKENFEVEIKKIEVSQLYAYVLDEEFADDLKGNYFSFQMNDELQGTVNKVMKKLLNPHTETDDA